MNNVHYVWAEKREGIRECVGMALRFSDACRL